MKTDVVLRRSIRAFSLLAVFMSTSVAAQAVLSSIKQLSSGTAHTCALTEHGRVKCWGSNSSGQLGDGTSTTRNQATLIGAALLSKPATAIAAGANHTCAILSDGAVKCWGSNSNGQLGNGTTNTSLVPVGVNGIGGGSPSNSAIAIAAGERHTCAALAGGGGIKCWGRNDYGQLGIGTNNTTDTTAPSTIVGQGTPQQITNGVTAVTAGEAHTCALVNGGIKCWGRSDDGRVGNLSATSPRQFLPIDVTGMTANVSSVVAGPASTCSVLSGGAYCWGDNQLSRLGVGPVGNPVRTPLPIKTNATTNLTNVVSLMSGGANGADHRCAALSTGALMCWGDNFQGQTGTGLVATPVTFASPVTSFASGAATAPGGLSGGSSFSCALTAEGSVRCWGGNASNQLGDLTAINRTAPVWTMGAPATVTKMALGAQHSCALNSEGGVSCWGSNSFGERNRDPAFAIFEPVSAVNIGEYAVDIAASGFTNCVVTVSSGVKCWGYNTNGELGDGTTTDRWQVTPVVGLSSGMARVRSYGEGAHFCAVSTLGAVRCWGRNTYGQLGNGSTAAVQSTPVAVSNLEVNSITISDVAVGARHTCALSSSPPVGRVFCWGSNLRGELGDGTYVQSSAPVSMRSPIDFNGLTPPPPTLAEGVAEITAGAGMTCIRYDNSTYLQNRGKVHCVGSTSDGRLGINPFDEPLSNVSETDLRRVGGANAYQWSPTQLATAGSSTCWKSTGPGGTGPATASCWGKNPQSFTTTVYFPTPPTTAGVSAVQNTNEEIKNIWAGSNHFCFQRPNDSIACWGMNFLGQLGSVLPVGNYTPTPVSSRIAPYVNTVAGAGGSISPSGVVVANGGTVVLAITANSNRTAQLVSGCGGTLVGTAPNYTLTTAPVTADCTVQVNFPLLQYAVTGVAAPVAGGSVVCNPAIVNHGSASSCSATPNPGYAFVSWSGACSGTVSPCTTSAITQASTATANFAQQCAPGSASASGTTPCTLCPLGKFAPTAGATSCTDASPGYFVPTQGATGQTACAVGFFSASAGSANCTPAAAGYFVGATGSSSQTACALGSYSAAAGAASCALADAGYFVATTAATSQTPCGIGSYSATAGASNCTPAAAGYFVPGTAATSQTPCAVGFYSPTPGGASCTPAAPGHFVPVAAATAQTPCAAGTYVATSAAMICTPASAGFYVPTAAATAQIPCPLGSTSGIGATACTRLPILNVDDSDAPDVYGSVTDGVILMRYLLGMRGNHLALGLSATNPRRSVSEMETHLATYLTLFDVDGDGSAKAMSDGLMILRRMIGLSGSALTAGAKLTTRSDDDVAAAIDALKP